MNLQAALEGPPWLISGLGWIQTHPVEAALILALAAAVEGLFLIGMLIPGSLLMFSAGAIAVAAEIPLTPVMLVAALGAWLGDCLSFYLGWRYRHNLPDIAARLRMPGAIARGQRFFARHGGKSIILGRLVGPLRPLVPAIAGASAMRPAHFVAIDLLAALLWAPAYALPGVLVGATISLAAEVTTRLGLLAALIFGLIWLVWWLVTHMVRLFQDHAEPWLIQAMDWSHKHRRLRRLGPALADPAQPETPVLLISLAVLGSLTWLIGMLWWGGLRDTAPPLLDDVAYDTLAALLTSSVHPIAEHINALAHQWVTLLLGISMLLLFASQRQSRLAAHWSAGLLGGGLLGLTLPGGAGLLIGPDTLLNSPTWTTASLSLWFSLAGLLTTRRSAGVRISLYLAVGFICGLMLLARLMLGQISFSQGVLAVLVCLAWASLLTLGYRRHMRGSRPPPLSPTLGLAGLLLIIGVTLVRPAPGVPQHLSWNDPERSPARINLLWRGTLPQIRDSLLANGWLPDPQPSPRLYINWLLPEAEQRPPAPQWLAGQRPVLRYTRKLNTGETLIVRLWPDGPRRWLGQAGHLSMRHWAGLLHVPVTDREAHAASWLAQNLSNDWHIQRAQRHVPLYRVEPHNGEKLK